ncbi:DUF6249 domain-containing protein [Mucilaginibacter sp. CAU 1740]|uniref:DUF6249 domain-containing protein n=1 Tax=Mucilaginibacter sp. CAU 1740 TaxID=3140365 RepID=UPI00325BEFA4
MDTGNLAILMIIIVSLGFFLMMFGIVYLDKREKLALIERNMDPRNYKPQSAPYQNLKWGLLLIGAGLGLFLAFVLDRTAFHYGDNSNIFFLYVSLIAFFGGVGLFVSYRIEKREVLDKEDQRIEKL